MLWQVPSDVHACIAWLHGGQLKWNVTFTMCLIAYASPNDTDPAGTHWRLLWIDINFTQMWPQRAWVHDWMNAHSHTYLAAKAQFEPLLGISLSLLPIPMRWHSLLEWNATSPFYLHGDYNTRVFGSVSVHYVHFLLHKRQAHTFYMHGNDWSWPAS